MRKPHFQVCLLELLESVKPQSPWDKLWACFLTKRPMKVTLRKWMSFGWRVATEEGFVGFIHKRFLHSPVCGRVDFTNPDLKGKEFEVWIYQIKEDYCEPVRYRDYSIEFCLYFKYGIGDLVAATVQSVGPRSISILIHGVRFVLRLEDINSSRRPVELSDVFRVGEVIKVFCVDSDEDGHVRWSHPCPGAGAWSTLEEQREGFLRKQRQTQDYLCRDKRESCWTAFQKWIQWIPLKSNRPWRDGRHGEWNTWLNWRQWKMQVRTNEYAWAHDIVPFWHHSFEVPPCVAPTHPLWWQSYTCMSMIVVQELRQGTADLALHGLLQFYSPFWDCEKVERLSTAADQYISWCTLRGCLSVSSPTFAQSPFPSGLCVLHPRDPDRVYAHRIVSSNTTVCKK